MVVRRNRMNPFGTTEEYNARLERYNNPTKRDKLNTHRYDVTQFEDMKIITLYNECKRLNDLEPYGHPEGCWEIDHIRPISQGGLHVYENLRLLRRRKNRKHEFRTESQIDFLTRLIALSRKEGTS